MTSRLVGVCIRLYPARWRARYGDELRQLLEEMDAQPRDFIDLLSGAIRSHLRSWSKGDIAMQPRGNQWPGWILTTAGLALAGWTGAFIVFNILRYNLGVGVDESSTWFYANLSPISDMLGVLGPPVIGFGLVVLGSTTISRESAPAGLVLVARVHPTRLTLVAGAFCAAVVVIIVAYVASENLLTALG